MEDPHPAQYAPTRGDRRARRRVALWIDEMNDDLRDALSAQGVELVAILQASHPDIASFSVHDLYYLAPSIDALSPVTAPAHWIDGETFRLYARCVQRVGFYPGSDFLESASGGVMHGTDVEDWARVHLTAALKVLDGLAVDEVWFCFNPHLGVDTMLALAAIRSGRKALVFTQIRFAPKFSWKQLGSNAISSPPDPDWKAWTAGALPPNLFYMRKEPPLRLDAAFARRVRRLMHRVARADWSAASSRLYRAARRQRMWWPMYLLERLDRRTRPLASQRLRARRDFARARGTMAMLPADAAAVDFVYFPLHLEPEENVHVLGGAYSNQLDAVAALHDALPAGWTLVLKENPLQTWQNRGEPFHRRLAALPNIRFASPAWTSAALIDRARVVATITGTASYEALLKGRACLYFGDAWFAGLPGATLFTPGIDLEALSRRRVTRQELDAAMNAMLSRAADGLAHPRYALIHGVDHDVRALYREAAHCMVQISDAAGPVPRDRSVLVRNAAQETSDGR